MQRPDGNFPVTEILRVGSALPNLAKERMEKFSLSARAYDRILKVARTIDDLDGAESIQSSFIAEAIQYRNLDRSVWRN